MKFCVECFGCRANQAEIQEWILDLEKAGYAFTRHQSEADFGILNTCSVTAKAERDVIRSLNRAFRRTHIPWIVAGCSVTRDKDTLQRRFPGYIFLNNTEKVNLAAEVRERFPLDSNLIYHSAFRSRYFLKIHDGCNFRCSYCIVPSLRGPSRSQSLDAILHRARYAASLGYREFVLTGINLSSYGFDLFPRRNLPEVITGLAKIPGVAFIRLSSLDPRYLRYDFVRSLKDAGNVCPSFHFSFQSGSNTVLKRMKRGSKVSEYRRILEMFSRHFPGANLGADFITGFPGETEKEHRETVEFVSRSNLNYMHVFPYSPRPGTAAARMEPLPDHVVRNRAGEMKQLNRGMRFAYREACLGRTVDAIIIEETPHFSMAVTENYLSVRMPPTRGFKQKRVSLEITRMLNDDLCEGAAVDLPRARAKS